MNKILRAWDRKKNTVAFVYRDSETGRTKIGEEKFDWFFYVKNKDFEKHKEVFTSLKEKDYVQKYESEHTYTKVFVEREHNNDLLDKNMQFVWEYKDKNLNYVLKYLSALNIQHFEADLKVYQRWLIGKNIQFESDLKILFLDIETDDRKILGQPIPGEFQILSCSMIDGTTGKKAWLCCEDFGEEHEKKFLEQLAKVLNGYDVLVGFNSSSFDFPYLKARMMMYGIQIDWRKKFLQDLMKIYQKLGPQLPSYSLDSIAKFAIQRGKVVTNKKIWELFKYDKPKLKEYNLEDSQLMVDIEVKTGFLAVSREVNVMGQCPCDDPYISRKIDNMILRQAYLDGHYHFKTKDYNEEIEHESFEGAFVQEPKLGLYKNVKVLDIGSLYPNTIRTFNISPDTLITEDNEMDIPKDQIIKCPSGHNFRKDFIGIIPKVIFETAEKRSYYKKLIKTVQPNSVEHKTYDKLQYVFKYFGLSFYGVLGLQTSRFYNSKVAESVTLGGQFFIKKSIEHLNSIGNPVIYSDTDSAFIQLEHEEKIPKIIKDIHDICQRVSIKDCNANECTVEFAYDKGFSKFIIIAKKRYAGYLTYLDERKLEVPKLYVAGLEFKRTDQCLLLKRKQEELLKMLLADKDMLLSDARKFLDDLKNYVFGKEIKVEDITFGQKLTKEKDQYKAKTMHLKVVDEMMRDGKEVYVGDKISYIIKNISKEGKPVPIPAYKFNGEFAKTYYWSNKILPALQRLLEVVFPKVDWSSYEFKISGKNKNPQFGEMNLW